MNGNAVIKSTMLGIEEDHGTTTCFLNLMQESSGQGFGGYSLEFYGIQMIRRILETVGVSNWEDLPGKYVRTEGDNDKIHKIGHITENKWYCPEEEIKETKE